MKSRNLGLGSIRVLLIAAPILLFLAVLSPRPAHALPLGTITYNGAVKCPASHGRVANGATCYSITVACPNTVNLDGWVAVASPPTNIGTITMMGAGPGILFFTNVFANNYLQLGYQTAQIAFATVWEDSGTNPGNVLAAACRPATVFNWIYANFHKGGKTSPYCLQGFSGGSGAVAYGLSHYGLKSEVDAAMVTAGPAMGDMEKGCTLKGSNLMTECGPGWKSDFTITPSKGTILTYPDKWDHTTTCSNNPSASDEAIWAASSIDVAPADYNYPQTVLSSFQCIGNEAPGQSMFFFNNVAPSSISKMQCAFGNDLTNPDDCQGEAYWLSPDGSTNTARLGQMINQMQNDCVPRH